MKLHSSLLLTSLCLPGALSDFLAPTYPAPTDITSSDSLVARAWRNATKQLEQSARINGTTGLNDLTFGVGLFSTQDEKAAKLQYHHTAPEIKNSSIGTKKVDGDSIYRIASVSKLFTALAGKIELSVDDWETPLSKIFPELAEFLREKSDTLDPVSDTQWDQITPSALAAQSGGIAQYAVPLSTDWVQTDLLTGAAVQRKFAFPALDLAELVASYPCAENLTTDMSCSDAGYLEGAARLPPVSLPWSTPIYSNNGFSILGLVIANLTGKSIHDVYQDSIFDPLEMASSYSDVPPESEFSRSVFAGAPGNFTTPNGLSTATGGLFSTINDLAKFSTGLLNSTLLSEHDTRRWMKPLTHTSSLYHSVGAPWEIYRWEHPSTGVVTDIYTKLGDSGNYGAITAFIPDYDAGFNVISASSDTAARSTKTQAVIQGIADAIVPALIEQAGKELARKYAGTYMSTDKKLNSSITFTPSKNETQGLLITSWISNGTDLMPHLYGAKGMNIIPPFALQPIIRPSGDSSKIAFRPATHPSAGVKPRDPSTLFTNFYTADQMSFLGDPTWGLQYVTEFVFDGDAETVTLPAYRVTLKKQ